MDLITMPVDECTHNRGLSDAGLTAHEDHPAAGRRPVDEHRDLIKLGVALKNRHETRCYPDATLCPGELAAFAGDEAWTRQVWRRDRRFTDLLPRGDATGYDIATEGHHRDQRHLCRVLPELRGRIDELAAEPRDEAVIRYVSANTGQRHRRTVALLRRLGLLWPPISGSKAGRQLGSRRSASLNWMTPSQKLAEALQ